MLRKEKSIDFRRVTKQILMETVCFIQISLHFETLAKLSIFTSYNIFKVYMQRSLDSNFSWLARQPVNLISYLKTDCITCPYTINRYIQFPHIERQVIQFSIKVYKIKRCLEYSVFHKCIFCLITFTNLKRNTYIINGNLQCERNNKVFCTVSDVPSDM